MRGVGKPGARRECLPVAISSPAELADIIYNIEGVRVPVGSLDISFYRDDASISGLPQLPHGTDILFNIDNKTIVLVDDVLFTGRTIRAALDALMDFGSPSAVSSLPSWSIAATANFRSAPTSSARASRLP